MLNLVQELREHNFNLPSNKPIVHCRVFEDNSGAVELSTVFKFRPRTKHINTKYHHFRSYVERKLISILKVMTENQLADMLTKPLNAETLQKHRRGVMGW
jgi:hypothetical protein